MTDSDGPRRPRRSRPATTPEGREQQLASLAYDLVEKRLRDGTATSQETTYFLKAGSYREQLERERIEHDNELTAARIVNLESGSRMEELYANAIDAMRNYSGQDPRERDEDYGT